METPVARHGPGLFGPGRPALAMLLKTKNPPCFHIHMDRSNTEPQGIDVAVSGWFSCSCRRVCPFLKILLHCSRRPAKRPRSAMPGVAAAAALPDQPSLPAAWRAAPPLPSRAAGPAPPDLRKRSLWITKTENRTHRQRWGRTWARFCPSPKPEAPTARAPPHGGHRNPKAPHVRIRMVAFGAFPSPIQYPPRSFSSALGGLPPRPWRRRNGRVLVFSEFEDLAKTRPTDWTTLRQTHGPSASHPRPPPPTTYGLPAPAGPKRKKEPDYFRAPRFKHRRTKHQVPRSCPVTAQARTGPQPPSLSILAVPVESAPGPG